MAVFRHLLLCQFEVSQGSTIVLLQLCSSCQCDIIMYNQYRPPTGGFGGPPPPPFGGPPAPAYGQFGGAPSGPSFGSGPSSQGGAGRDAHDDKLSKVKDPLLTAVRWLKGRSSQEKLVLGCLAGVVVSVFGRLECFYAVVQI